MYGLRESCLQLVAALTRQQREQRCEREQQRQRQHERQAVCLAGKIDLANRMKKKNISPEMINELFDRDDSLVIGQLDDEEDSFNCGIEVGIQEGMKEYLMSDSYMDEPDISCRIDEKTERIYLADGTFLQFKKQN
ncbi:MAG: hypothetical protein K6F44_04515 [Lachnospiraceae bacterium]|nr:hypothetical protein [Lachnospiraceae bacterium]